MTGRSQIQNEELISGKCKIKPSVFGGKWCVTHKRDACEYCLTHLYADEKIVCTDCE